MMCLIAEAAMEIENSAGVIFYFKDFPLPNLLYPHMGDA